MRDARILVVEDDVRIADVVLYMLTRQGYRVETAADGREGLRCFRMQCPDLVVLDLNLPYLSGRELFAIMRREKPTVPVIMLTCQSDEVDRIVGLEMGADDYISKPFNAKELAARVRAVLRRCHPAVSNAIDCIEAGPVRIDVAARRFRYGGRDVALTRQEFALMQALTGSPARTYSRDELIARMYDGAHPVTDRSVDACIKRIRRKLQTIHPGQDPIRTEYGIGYKFNEQLTVHP